MPNDLPPIALLPDFPLTTAGSHTQDFQALGCQTFHQAAQYVWHLPYGRNTNRADFSLVLREGRGTCSTKHALLAAVARAHKQPVTLMLGIYEMHDENTPGVGGTLDEAGLPYVPEAHCYLVAGGQRVDLTRQVQASAPISHFLLEEPLTPEGIGAHKVERHRAFVREWALARSLDAEQVWRVREACIRALRES